MVVVGVGGAWRRNKTSVDGEGVMGRQKAGPKVKVRRNGVSVVNLRQKDQGR